MKYLLLIMLSFNCFAEFRTAKQHNSIDPAFIPYINQFVYLSKGKIREHHLAGLTMGFKKFPKEEYTKENGGTVGVCHPVLAYEIDINEDWWKINTEIRRFELIFHELGHCVLRRGHTEKSKYSGFFADLEGLMFDLGIYRGRPYLKDGCPSSFMYPTTIKEYCINKHLRFYIDEMFERSFVNDYTFETYKTAMICKEPQVVNNTDFWDDQDQNSLNATKISCIKKYNSCLKYFLKKESGLYNAICGN